MSEAAIQRATAAHREWNRQRQAETVSEQRARMAETAEELSEIEYLRDDPAPAPSEHTPREVADFLIDEFLQPAGESVIYSDYRMQYEDEGHGTREEFDQRYNEGVALLRAAPELLEALEKLLVIVDRLNFDTYHIPAMRHPNGSSCEWKEQVDARAALAAARGKEGAG
jgi:hypothetical protein